MRVIKALWGSSHPGPSLVVTALAVALGAAAGLDPLRVVLLALAVLAGQLSVGLSNDALDAARDRATGRDDKPLARDEVAVRTVWIAASASLVVALAVSAVLGWRMLAAHALALGSAWAYNAGLKATALSPVPFVVSFGLLPSLATLSAVPPSFAAWWAWLAGAALGVAVHFTNVLPDLADDERTGVRGMPHRLGGRASAIVAALAVVAGALAVLLGPVHGDAGAVAAVGWVLFVAVVATAAVTAVRAMVRPPTRALFRLVMLAGLLLAAQLVVSGSALLG